MMMKVLLIIALGYIPLYSIKAQDNFGDSTYFDQNTENSNPARITSNIGFVLLAALPTIAIHETGHYLTAATLNPTSNRIALLPPQNHAYFKRELKKGELTALSLSGVTATRLTAEGLDGLLNEVSMGSFGNRLGGALYLTTRLDMPFHVLFSCISHGLGAFPDNEDDIYKGIINPYFEKQKALIYISLISLIALDIFFDRHEIQTNYKRLKGVPSPKRKPDNFSVGFGFDRSRQSVSMTLRHKFN